MPCASPLRSAWVINPPFAPCGKTAAGGELGAPQQRPQLLQGRRFAEALEHGEDRVGCALGYRMRRTIEEFLFDLRLRHRKLLSAARLIAYLLEGAAIFQSHLQPCRIVLTRVGELRVGRDRNHL